jgi:hypothetical protein
MDNIFINSHRYKIRIEGNEWFVHQPKDPFDVVNDFGELIGWGVAAPGVDPRTAAFDAMQRAEAITFKKPWPVSHNTRR